MSLRVLAVSVLIGVHCMACGGSTPPAETAGLSQERQPETPENHRAAVKRLFQVTEIQKVLDSSVEVTLKSQIEADPTLSQFEDIMREFLTEHMGWASLEPEFVDMYMQAFTQREVEDLIAFYKTPAGKKSIVMVPELMKQGAAVGQRRVQEHLPELKQKVQERVQELQGSKR